MIPTRPDGRRWLHFQEYWVRLRAVPDALAVRRTGIEDTRPAAGVAEAIASADLVLVAPSNPVVSIGPILEVPGIRAALVATAAPVIGFAGILGRRSRAGHGPPAAAGHRGGGRRGGRRPSLRLPAAGGVLDLWVMDSADADSAAGWRRTGCRSPSPG